MKNKGPCGHNHRLRTDGIQLLAELQELLPSQRGHQSPEGSHARQNEKPEKDRSFYSGENKNLSNCQKQDSLVCWNRTRVVGLNSNHLICHHLHLQTRMSEYAQLQVVASDLRLEP